MSKCTLHDQHRQLMEDIQMCDNMIDPDSEDQNEQAELQGEMEELYQELGMVEEVIALKYAVDCDCFYR